MYLFYLGNGTDPWNKGLHYPLRIPKQVRAAGHKFGGVFFVVVVVFLNEKVQYISIYRGAIHAHLLLRCEGAPSIQEIKDAMATGGSSDKIRAAQEKVINFTTLQAGISANHPVNDPPLWCPPEGSNNVEPLVNVLRQTFGDITSSHEEAKIAYGRLVNRTYMHKCKLNYCLKQKGRPKKEKSDKAGASGTGKDGKANEAAAKPKDGQEQKKEEEADKGVSIGGKRHYCRFGFPASVVGYKYTWKETPNGDIISNVRRQFEGEPDDGPIDEDHAKHVLDDPDEVDAIFNAISTENAESVVSPTVKFPDGAGFVPITVETADGVVVTGHKFFMLRNHPKINSHIPEVALAWQGNTDTKFIFDCDQVTAYLNKYINKPEPRSADQSKIARAAASDVNVDRPARKGIQQLLLQTINREISKQECYLQLNKKHGYHKLALPVKLMSLSGQKQVLLNHLSDPDAPITKKNSMADIYWRREEDPNYQAAVAEFEADPEAWKAKAHSNWATPKHPKDVSLHLFAAYFNDNWKFHNREYIPCFSPRLKIVPRCTNLALYEMHCRTRLLQFKPGATPTNLLDMRGKFVWKGVGFFFQHIFATTKNSPLCT